jgi:hypothetical protein
MLSVGAPQVGSMGGGLGLALFGADEYAEGFAHAEEASFVGVAGGEGGDAVFDVAE